jgi:hypothetical protein
MEGSLRKLTVYTGFANESAAMDFVRTSEVFTGDNAGRDYYILKSGSDDFRAGAPAIAEVIDVS